MIWAVETYTGKRWTPAEGALFTSRDRARRHKKWAEDMFPWRKYRVTRYVRSNVRT
jgi:hypothetical protein